MELQTASAALSRAEGDGQGARRDLQFEKTHSAHLEDVRAIVSDAK